jgi:hypothetical protein
MAMRRPVVLLMFVAGAVVVRKLWPGSNKKDTKKSATTTASTAAAVPPVVDGPRAHKAQPTSIVAEACSGPKAPATGPIVTALATATAFVTSIKAFLTTLTTWVSAFVAAMWPFRAELVAAACIIAYLSAAAYIILMGCLWGFVPLILAVVILGGKLDAWRFEVALEQDALEAHKAKALPDAAHKQPGALPPCPAATA